MTPPTSIYQLPQSGNCLSQGEILSDLTAVRADPAKVGEEETSVSALRFIYPYAIVLSQACDLEQDFNARKQQNNEKHLLSSVLFCRVALATELKGAVGGSDIWKRVRQNKDERYHCLEKIPSESDGRGQGIEDMGIDFKTYFTIATEEVYRLIELGRTHRRSVLTTPYQLHISSRFAYFLSRVPLPRDHAIGAPSGGTPPAAG